MVKVGGAALKRHAELWPQVKALHQEAPVVVVHGGGAAATALAKKLGHQPRIVRGRRVTTALDLSIIEWTLRGGVSLMVVGHALTHGLRAVGLSGADGAMVRVTRRKPWIIDGEEVDFGFVGDIGAVRPDLVTTLLTAGYLPVVAPVGIDVYGQRYNVNADTVAGALAVALGAQALLLVTAAGGIRRQADDPATRIQTLTIAALKQGQDAGWIAGGMHVKGQVAADVLRRGVPHVYVTGPGCLVERASATRIVLKG